jgi:glycosyltransferase involved in cell wall biosynthesis
LIVGDTGWVVPAREPEALSQALAQALGEWKIRSVWSERQRLVRERITVNFSIERMVAHYRDVWLEAINVSKN